MAVSASNPQANLASSSTAWTRLGITALSSLAAAGIAVGAYFLHFNLSTTGSLELLLVVIIALRWGLLASTGVSVTAVLCLNYLFAPPLFALSVADPKNWVSLGTFEATALLVSRLSFKVRLHAAQVEVERARNAKLYELSRAILLIDGRRSTAEQISELIRELIEVGSVELWSVYAAEPSADKAVVVDKGSAHNTYLFDRDSDDPSARVSRRVLRSGTTAIGAIVLQEWEADPPLADAVASLVAVALERARAIRKENQAEAERNTEQLRTAVLDGLAHGFKTPLTAIQTASSGLLAIRQMTPTQTELVTIIDEQATVLNHLTTRLLQTAALEANEVKLRRSDVDLIALVYDLVDEQSNETQSRVVISAEANVQPVSVDAHLIKLALLQLIDNAAKYATVGLPIGISITQTENETIVTVTNEGPPIKPEEQERIFQRFYRGLDSSRGPTGTGIGLSIVRKTAEAHGGRVWVDSKGSTTRFSLAIPRYKGTRNG